MGEILGKPESILKLVTKAVVGLFAAAFALNFVHAILTPAVMAPTQPLASPQPPSPQGVGLGHSGVGPAPTHAVVARSRPVLGQTL
jgi:hypothetical protein